MNTPMSWKFTMPLVAACAVMSSSVLQSGVCRAQQPLGFNNVVVLQTGNGVGSAGSTSTVVSLREFTPSGAPVQTITMPSSGTGTKLVSQANQASEGTLSISPDGRWIAFGGYDTGTGVSSASTTLSGTVPRVAGLLDTTTGTYSLIPMGSALSGRGIRGVATNDGNNLWVIGSGTGLSFGTVAGGAGSFGKIGDPALPDNYNAIGVYSGTSTNLFASCSTSGAPPTVGLFGTAALPTGTATTFTAQPGVPNSVAGNLRTGFVYLDANPAVPGLDTLYVANSISNSDGILKYSLDVTGTWVARGSILSSGLTLRGLSGFVSGTSVSLFTTTTNTLYSYWDADAAGGVLSGNATSVLTSIATAPSFTAFRGVMVVPEPATVALIGTAALILGAESVRRRRSRRSR